MAPLHFTRLVTYTKHYSHFLPIRNLFFRDYHVTFALISYTMIKRRRELGRGGRTDNIQTTPLSATTVQLKCKISSSVCRAPSRHWRSRPSTFFFSHFNLFSIKFIFVEKNHFFFKFFIKRGNQTWRLNVVLIIFCAMFNLFN